MKTTASSSAPVFWPLQNTIVPIVASTLAAPRSVEPNHRLLPIELGSSRPVHPKRVAVVTGAGGERGMGLEAVRQLAARGMTVVLTSRHEQEGKALVRKLQAEGLDVVYQRLDVTRPRSVKSLAGFLEHTYGRVDVLINNAGVLLESLDHLGDVKAGGLLGTDSEILSRSFSANALGALQVAESLVPLMSRGGGQIINLTSRMSTPEALGVGAPAYRLSKAALNHVTHTLAVQLADRGIKVNAVDPGWVATDMGGAGAPASVSEGVSAVVGLALMALKEAPTDAWAADRKKLDDDLDRATIPTRQLDLPPLPAPGERTAVVVGHDPALEARLQADGYVIVDGASAERIDLLAICTPAPTNLEHAFMVATNGVASAIKEALPKLERAGGGRIVQIPGPGDSEAARLANHVAYSTSLLLADELAPSHIEVRWGF